MELSGRGLRRIALRRRVGTALSCVLTVLIPLSARRTRQRFAAAVVGGQLATPAARAPIASWSDRDFREAVPAEAPADPTAAFDLPDLGGAEHSVANGHFVP